jgi:hypothetical protein
MENILCGSLPRWLPHHFIAEQVPSMLQATPAQYASKKASAAPRFVVLRIHRLSNWYSIMASTSSVDLKLCEIELPSNLACKETLNRLLSQNALWSAHEYLSWFSFSNRLFQDRISSARKYKGYQ